WGDDILILSTWIMSWFVECTTPDMSPEDRRDPAVSPLYADLGGLVPALFTAGTADPLIDDSLSMAPRRPAAGNDAEVVIYPDAPHGFIAFPCAIGRMGLERHVAFIARHAKG